MKGCLNTNDPKYRKLERMSGISRRPLADIVRASINRNGRMPEIDEIPSVNTVPYLVSTYNLKQIGVGKMVGKMENVIPSGDVDNDIKNINSRHRDLEISGYDFGEEIVLDVVKRPNVSEYSKTVQEYDSFDDSPSRVDSVINIISDKAKKLYGINIIPFNSSMDMPELSGIDISDKNGFILSGNIYINTDNASFDAPVHEMMHMLLGEMKFNDANLYNSLVESMAEVPWFDSVRNRYFKDLTYHDALEEMFVMQVSKYLTGDHNAIDSLPLEIRSKIEYNVKRMIDTMFMGDNSSQLFNLGDMAKMNVMELCDLLGSSIMKNRSRVNGDPAYSHRVVSNIKSELLRDGKLEEICN